MADDDEVVCPLCFEEGQAPAPVTQRDARARTIRPKRGPRNHALLVCAPHLPLPHTRDPSCRAPLTRDHPQACEPRCADVFKHYLACADRIEQKGAGMAGAASLNTNRRHRHAIAHRRDRDTKKTRRRLRALLLRLAQVHRQVRDAAHHVKLVKVAKQVIAHIAHVRLKHFRLPEDQRWEVVPPPRSPLDWR